MAIGPRSMVIELLRLPRNMGGHSVLEEFIPSESFDGVRPAYVFQSGASGNGYYIDTAGMRPPVVVQARKPAHEPLEQWLLAARGAIANRGGLVKLVRLGRGDATVTSAEPPRYAHGPRERQAHPP